MSYERPAVVDGALRLHFNENTAGCSASTIEAIRAFDREAAACYPDYERVTARVAQWLGVESDRVQLTNGLDEGLLTAALWTLHGPAIDSTGAAMRSEIVIVEPAFEVYAACAEAVGARIVRVAPSEDLQFSLDRTLAAITPATRLVYLTDPNNPTGLGLPAGAAEAIAARAPQALVLVDEAYANFSGRTLVGPRLERQPNLVVGRTFAKAHGLAGLRVGALVAHADTIAALRRLMLPFSVNACAIAALEAALEDRAYLDWYVAQSVESRTLVYNFCRRHDLPFWPSEANFVLFRAGADAGVLVDAAARRSVLLRNESHAPGCAGCVRMTAGVVEHTKTALTVLEDALASRAH